MMEKAYRIKAYSLLLMRKISALPLVPSFVVSKVNSNG